MPLDGEAPEHDILLEGRYANYLRVGNNQLEFVLDFGQFNPDKGDIRFFTRLITSPAYAKSFSDTLTRSIRQHEENYGVIPDGK